MWPPRCEHTAVKTPRRRSVEARASSECHSALLFARFIGSESRGRVREWGREPQSEGAGGEHLEKVIHGAGVASKRCGIRRAMAAPPATSPQTKPSFVGSRGPLTTALTAPEFPATRDWSSMYAPHATPMNTPPMAAWRGTKLDILIGRFVASGRERESRGAISFTGEWLPLQAVGGTRADAPSSCDADRLRPEAALELRPACVPSDHRRFRSRCALKAARALAPVYFTLETTPFHV